MASDSPYRSFKPKFIPKPHIEREADGLLGEFCRTFDVPFAPPIPVEDILEKHLKLVLEFRDMEKLLGQSNILGATWIDKCLVCLDNQLDEQPGRLAFTISHEIGHWRLHRPQFIIEREMPVLFEFGGETAPPNIVCRSHTSKKDSMEWQADFFAACLLMPTDLMKETFARLYPNSIKPPLDLCREGMWEERKIWLQDLAVEMIEKGGFSNCSREAMRIRIEDLKLVDFSATGSLF